MTEVTHSFRFGRGAGVTAVGSLGGVPGDIELAAKQGGSEVLEVFQRDLQALQALREHAFPASVWIRGTDNQSGLPVRYVAVGDDFLTFGLTVPPDYREKLNHGSGGIDDYITAGFFYLTLSVNADQGTDAPPQVSQVMTGTVEYAGGGLAGFSAGTEFLDLMDAVVGKGVDFIAALIGELVEEAADSLTTAGSDVEDAVSDSAKRTEGVETFDAGGAETAVEFAVELGSGVEIVLQLVSLAVLLPLQLLARQLTGYVRVYNATQAEIDTSLAWVAEGNQWAGAEVATAVSLPAHGPAWTPAAIIGPDATHYVSWVVGNTDLNKGVGYVVRLAASGDFPGANVMVAIPNQGNNSLAVAFGEDDDSDEFWNAHQGQDTGLTASATSGPYRIRVATNQVSGKSPAPADGTLSYSYEHIVLIDQP